MTLQELLYLTRQVFAGEVTRAQLAHRTSRELAFVGNAILLAVREPFLDDNNLVRNNYGPTLENLLVKGEVNSFAGEQGYKYGGTIVAASKMAGLYQSTQGQGGIKPIRLTPPPELVALVKQLGRTPAIDMFLQEAAAGVSRHERRADEYRRKMPQDYRNNGG